MKKTIPHKHGFTLIEILLALTILGILTVFAMKMSHSFRTMTKARETRSRMELIAKKAKDYYRGHRNLPLPDGPPPAAGVLPAVDNDPPTTVDAGPVNADDYGVTVPVGAADLDMEQKYRMDGWGRYLQYITFRNDNDSGRPGLITIDRLNAGGELINIPRFDKTLIRGVNVNNRRYAGVIISSGPNQVFEYTTTTTPWTANDNALVYVKQYALNTGSDDIFVVIDLSEEAFEVAFQGAKAINEKAIAFDKLFPIPGSTASLGGCDKLEGSGVYCPPDIGTNNPICGTATLDYIKKSDYYDATCEVATTCVWGDVDSGWDKTSSLSSNRDETDNDAARAFIYCYYSLPDSAVYDPWLNGYIWGCLDTVWINSPLDIVESNPRYHKFFSAGPDGELGDISSTEAVDDIIP